MAIDGMGLPGGSYHKESACNARDLDLIPGWGRSPGEGNGYPLLYSCLENPMDRGSWWVTVHRVAKSDATEQLTLSYEYFCPSSSNSYGITAKFSHHQYSAILCFRCSQKRLSSNLSKVSDLSVSLQLTYAK